jgi:hypothetical protein
MTSRKSLGLVLTLALGAMPAAHAADSAGEREALRAEHDRKMAQLRAAYEKQIAEIRAQVTELESKRELLRRIVPPVFEREALEKVFRILAESGPVDGFEVTFAPGPDRVPLAGGGVSPYERFHVDIAGQAHDLTVRFVFDRLSRLPRLIELESLQLDARPDHALRFAARLGFPVETGWPESEATPRPAPVRPRGTGGGASDARGLLEQSLAAQQRFYEEQREAARARLRRIQAEIATIGEMIARKPAWALAVLAAFGKRTEDSPVALRRARFGPEVVIEGVAVGAVARAGLSPAFERAGLVVTRADIASTGDCRAFTLTGRRRPEEDAADVAAPMDTERGRFDDRIDAACAAAPAPMVGRVSARGINGDLDLRLRGADLGDVFRVLHELTPASFIVDADVRGRVDVDLEHATLDQALAAIAEAGVTVGAGRLRRVSRTGTARPPVSPSPKYTGDTISLSFKRGALGDVLRLFQDIAERPAWTSPVVNGYVHVYCRDIPWDEALHAIAVSNGLQAVIESKRLFVGPPAMARAPWSSGAVEVRQATTTDVDPLWRGIHTLVALEPEDLTLVGLARQDGQWTALAYGPDRRLWSFAAGAQLYISRVQAVGADGVTFEGKDGRRHVVTLAP